VNTGLINCFLLLLVVIGGVPGTRLVRGAESPAFNERQIKAAFILNFTKFVEWPEATFARDEARLVIGIFGHDPMTAEVRRVALGFDGSGTKFMIQEVTTVAAAGEVHLLFVPSSADGTVAELLEGLKDYPILTIGESEAFQAAGGMIRFVREKDKIRFEIQTDSARRSKVRISAQLQKLARPSTRRN
jgi:hypothetical protein